MHREHTKRGWLVLNTINNGPDLDTRMSFPSAAHEPLLPESDMTAVPPTKLAPSLELLDPIPKAGRTWTSMTYIAMWAGITIQPSSFVFGAALLSDGLSISEAAVVLVVGNMLLLLPLCLNGIPGVKHGIPFPVLLRSAFGYHGAVVPVLIRGLVGIGWASFNLFLGSDAIYHFILNVNPRVAHSPVLGPHLNLVQLVCFVGFLILHLCLAAVGMKRLKPFVRVSSIIQSGGMIALVVWSFSSASLHEIYEMSEELKGNPGNNTLEERMLTGITASCAGWSTLVLNIADLSRFSRSENDFVVGQVIGFPMLNVLMPLLGIVAFSAAKHAYPLDLSAQDWKLTTLFSLWHPAPAFIGTVIYALAVLNTNCTANLLSAANDICSIAPRLGFGKSFAVALFLASILMPWQTFASAQGFVGDFLTGIGMFTGSILGVMLADYYVVSKKKLNVKHLYSKGTTYRYYRGWNMYAIVSMLGASALCIPGYIELAILDIDTSSVWSMLFNFSWIVSTSVSFLVYIAFLRCVCVNKRDDVTAMDGLSVN
eukprot:m.118730 g.118730  ORF g.118730 m.118730 type:complete len:540 (-) comp28691_c0_seq2:114-1733(-)